MHVECVRSSFKSGDGRRTPPPPLRQSRANSSLPPDPHLCAGVLRGGAGGGIQQTQEPLPQPDARCRRHSNSALPAAQDRHGGESPEPTSTGPADNLRDPDERTGTDLSWFERIVY